MLLTDTTRKKHLKQKNKVNDAEDHYSQRIKDNRKMSRYQ